MKEVNLNHRDKLIAMKLADIIDLISSAILIIIFSHSFKEIKMSILHIIKDYFSGPILYFSSLSQACLNSFWPTEEKETKQNKTKTTTSTKMTFF